MMSNNNIKEGHEQYREIKISGHGQMTKRQAKALRDKWNAKIHGTCDSDNGDNASRSITPP
jgi:hypothetical protein